MIYAEACGAALARAHARSGEAATIAGYLGQSDAFDRAIVEFAGAYAEQTGRPRHAPRSDPRRSRRGAARASELPRGRAAQRSRGCSAYMPVCASTLPLSTACWSTS